MNNSTKTIVAAVKIGVHITSSNLLGEQGKKLSCKNCNFRMWA